MEKVMVEKDKFLSGLMPFYLLSVLYLNHKLSLSGGCVR